VRAANGIPVISVGAHNVHPSVAAIMDYSAVVGGCQSGSTVLGNKLAGSQPIATVSGALLQIMGSPGKALGAFDRSVAPDVPRVGYVDPRGDVVAQTMEVARLMKDRLDAIRLARVPGGKPIPVEVIKEVRQQLDSMGYQHVEIVLSGDMSPSRIQSLIAGGAPVNVFHDGGYIASSSPIAFRPNIRTISDRPVPQESDPPAHNPRLMRLL
jgi:nicotinate phosphoribosyltransferase